MVVKEQFEAYPKISYPMVTIEEISNENVDKFWDGQKDNVSYLAYQIGIYAEQTELLTAMQNVKHIADTIDDYMKGDKYKCLRRIGNLNKMPKFS